MFKPSFTAVFAVFFIASGCSTMTKDECLNANWQAIGQKDAEQGLFSSNIATYGKQCAEHGVIPNEAQYGAGYQSGIKIFCTKSNGFEQGKKGKNNQGICPADLAKDFEEGHGVGREYYAVLSVKDGYETKINANNKKIKKLIKQVKKLTAKKGESETTSEEKKQIALDILAKQYEANQLNVEIQSIRPKLAVSEYQYTELVKKYGYQ